MSGRHSPLGGARSSKYGSRSNNTRGSNINSSSGQIGNRHRVGSCSSRQNAFIRVVDCAVTAEQGTRPTMEDQHTMLADSVPFFGVYDGHGGTHCAEYLRDRLHGMILSHKKLRTEPEEAIRESIIQVDKDFLERKGEGSNESGSVCAVAIILNDVLVVGNVGDCEVVLSRNSAPIVLTVKHTLASNPDELKRVEAAGGKIYNKRIGHPKFNAQVVNLGVSRAIGDAGFKLPEYTDGKPSGVIADPHTCSLRLQSDRDEFLVMACDGLWDVMSYEEVVDFCARRFQSGEVAQTITDDLAQAALDRGGRDNVTAMVIHLKMPSARTSPQRSP